MKRVVVWVVFLGVIGVIQAADLPYGTVSSEEGVYTLELIGLGFAYESPPVDTAKVNPETFVLKIYSRVQKLEAAETSMGSVPVSQKVLVKPSAIRLGYNTYPLEVIELSSNYLEAKVFSSKVTELGQIVSGEQLGTIKLVLTVFTGLPGGKGTLTLGKKNYTLYMYRKEALEGFNRWINEIE